MKYSENIQSINRYLINDEDRSGKLRLDKNEFNVPFPIGMVEEIRNSIDDYILQAYPSTWNTLGHASFLLEHDDVDEILLVPGSDYALKLCYESFLNGKTGRVGLPEPTYAMNEVYAKIAGAKIETFPYQDDFRLDRDAVFKSLPDLDMIVLANPNQPTGQLETDDFVLELLIKARENDVWVVIDEAYYSFSSYTAAGYLKDFSNLIITRSFSKSYGIAGLRTGAILSSVKNIEYLSKVLPVYCVNSISLKLLKILSKHKSDFDKIHGELILSRKEITSYYDSIGCRSIKSDTNFVMVESNGLFDVTRYIENLKENNILIRGPWTRSPYGSAFRISVSSRENILALQIATDRFLKSL